MERIATKDVTAMESRRTIGIEAERGHTLEPFFVQDAHLDPCQVRADATMRPGVKCHMDLVLAIKVKAHRLDELLGVKVAGREEQ